MRGEVPSYRHPEDPKKCRRLHRVLFQIQTFWKRKTDKFIPIQSEFSLVRTISLVMKDIKSGKVTKLFNIIKPSKRRDHVSEEIVEEIQGLAMIHGGSNGEDQIDDACRNLLKS
jgi:hypothetical protein